MLDAIRHGSMPEGEEHNQSKLIEKEVLEIRRLRSAGNKLIKIGKMFNTSLGNVSAIACKRKWKHI